MSVTAHPSRQPVGFAGALKTFRKVQGLSIRQLAAASGVSVAQITALERPARTGEADLRVRRQTALKLADGLGLTDADRASFLAAAGHRDAELIWTQPAKVSAAREVFRLTRYGTSLQTAPPAAGRAAGELPGAASRGEDVADAAIGLFRTALTRHPRPVEVLITFIGPEPSMLDSGQAVRGRWNAAIADLLDQGVRVTHIWDLPAGVTGMGKAVRLAQNVLAFADRSGHYDPRVVREATAGRWRGIPDMIVVPGHAAIVMIIPGTTALIVDQPSQLALALLAVETVKYASEEIFQVFKADSEGVLAFEEKFGDYETDIRGSRQLLKGAPTSLWIHPDTEERVARRAGMSGEPLRRHLASARRRFEAFEDQLTEYSHRELIPRQAVEDFALRREPPRDTLWNLDGNSRVRYEADEVGAALGQVIARLDRFPDTYELALGDEEPDAGLATAFWEVKQAADRSAVLIETWSSGSAHRTPSLIIDDVDLAQGFSSWFNGLWYQVPEEWRSRQHVRQWLKDLQQRASPEHESRRGQ